MYQTVHKAQGRTLTRVILALGKRPIYRLNMTFSSVFVTLSRVKRSEHIRLLLSPHCSRESQLIYITELQPPPEVFEFFSGYDLPSGRPGPAVWDKAKAIEARYKRCVGGRMKQSGGLPLGTKANNTLRAQNVAEKMRGVTISAKRQRNDESIKAAAFHGCPTRLSDGETTRARKRRRGGTLRTLSHTRVSPTDIAPTTAQTIRSSGHDILTSNYDIEDVFMVEVLSLFERRAFSEALSVAQLHPVGNTFAHSTNALESFRVCIESRKKEFSVLPLHFILNKRCGHYAGLVRHETHSSRGIRWYYIDTLRECRSERSVQIATQLRISGHLRTDEELTLPPVLDQQENECGASTPYAVLYFVRCLQERLCGSIVTKYDSRLARLWLYTCYTKQAVIMPCSDIFNLDHQDLRINSLH